MENENPKQPRSALAIAGLVLGILGLVTSLLPFINNVSFFVALIGAALAIAGLVTCMRGKRAGKGLAIGAIVVNVVAIGAVLASQSMYGAAIDSAMEGPQAVEATQSGDKAKDEKGKGDDAKKDSAKDLAVGSVVDLQNGLSVSVDEVVPGLTNFDGAAMTGVRVTYANNGEEPASFSEYDWKGENASGVRSDTSYYSEATEGLSYGDLASGGTVTGFIYFEEGATKVMYFSSPFADEPAASWIIA